MWFQIDFEQFLPLFLFFIFLLIFLCSFLSLNFHLDGMCVWGGAFVLRFLFCFVFSGLEITPFLDFYFFRGYTRDFNQLFILTKYVFCLQYISFILSCNCNVIIILYVSVYVHYFLTYHSVCICTFLPWSYFFSLE